MMGVRHSTHILFQTLFILEHNRLAAQFAQDNNDWSDEQIFEEARKWTVATMQYICWFEYLPALGVQLAPYDGYKPNVNPSVDNFFASVSHSLGHHDFRDITSESDDMVNETNPGNAPLSKSPYPSLKTQNDGELTRWAVVVVSGIIAFGCFDLCASWY